MLPDHVWNHYHRQQSKKLLKPPPIEQWKQQQMHPKIRTSNSSKNYNEKRIHYPCHFSARRPAASGHYGCSSQTPKTSSKSNKQGIFLFVHNPMITIDHNPWLAVSLGTKTQRNSPCHIFRPPNSACLQNPRKDTKQ